MEPSPAVPRPRSDLGRWLQEARNGSSTALGQLLNAYRPYLLSLARSNLQSDLQAKASGSDLVQQTFLEAKQSFAQFDGHTEAELLAWLRRILEHNLADLGRHYRGTGKREVGREVSLETADSSAVRVGDLPAGGPSPSGLALEREQAEAIQCALAQLPEEYCRVILLRNRERRTFAEIGAALGRSTEAARKLWSRAIERLQQELGSEP